ncbi:MAG: ABC transporter substrate-binding protein [Candidatus Latescibacterota bacterium]|nr:ABC transporter substrate-binding protein [Candidatus Latescibacterota bacterium]
MRNTSEQPVSATQLPERLSQHLRPGIRQTQRLITGLLLLCLTWLSCGSDKGGGTTGPVDEAEPVRVGLLVPISGPWVKGLVWRQAAQRAIDEINAQGGVLDRSFELLVAETETVPSIAVEGARALVEDGVVAVIGAGASSSSIMAAEQVLIPAGVLLISPSSTSPAIAYPELSSDQIDAFDYSGVVERAFGEQPDLIYLITYDQDGAKITVAATNHVTDDYIPTFLGCDGNASQAFLDNSAPGITEGMVGTVPIAPEDHVDYLAFVARVARYGIEPETFSESTYDAVYLLALATLHAQSVEPTRIAASMQTVSVGGTPVTAAQFSLARNLLRTGEDIDYTGAAGSLDFDDVGDILSGTYRIWRVEGGSFSVIQTTAFP